MLFCDRENIYMSSHLPRINISNSIFVIYQHRINGMNDKFIYTYSNVLYIRNRHTSSIEKNTQMCPNRKNRHILFNEWEVCKKVSRREKALLEKVGEPHVNSRIKRQNLFGSKNRREKSWGWVFLAIQWASLDMLLLAEIQLFIVSQQVFLTLGSQHRNDMCFML